MQQLDDVRVVDLAQYLDLTVHVLHLLLVQQFVLLIDLEDHLLPCVFVCGQFDQCVGASADGLLQGVVLKLFT